MTDHFQTFYEAAAREVHRQIERQVMEAATFGQSTTRMCPAPETLTIESLNRQILAMKAAAPLRPTWSGNYFVVPEEFLPRQHIGDAVYPYRGHRFWRWLWACFGREFPTTLERGYPLYRASAIVMDGKMLISRAMEAGLRNHLRPIP